MINPNFVILAALINMTGSASYILHTLQGKTKPNRVSFLMWGIAPLIAFFAQISEGVGLVSLMTLTVGLGPLLIFLASFFNPNGSWKLRKFDYFCGSVSIIGLILWAITGEGVVAIIFSLTADLFASIPTIVKSFTHPETESWLAYFMAGLAGLITMLTIETWDFVTAAFPVYIFSVCVLLVALIRFKLGQRIMATEDKPI